MKRGMNKNNGFTLIELLAVIVILAVIALIATPLVLNIIERAEKGAFKDSVYGIMEAAEFQVILDDSKYPITFMFPEDSERMKFKGTKPTEGYIQVVNEGKIKLALGNGRWCATKNENDSQVTIANGHCEYDLNRPIISGYGDLNQEININDTYTLPNVIATDKDGNKLNVTTTIKQGDKVVESIDTSKEETYTIIYTTEPDKNGNQSSVTVTIQIINHETDTDKLIEAGTEDGNLDLIGDTYYFRGTNPNNYIKFNEELWRIISIEDGCMKIIRNTAITGQAWDASVSQGSNNWTRPANINTYLNGTFYNSLRTEAKNQIQEREYYIGVVNFTTSVSAAAIKNDERAATWTGKVGLMNGSDYAYSSKTDDSNASACIHKATNNINCKNGWLYKNIYEWTMNATNSLTSSLLYTRVDGGLYESDNTSTLAVYVRPVVFLKSDVKIASGGKGTSSSPYILQ